MLAAGDRVTLQTDGRLRYAEQAPVGRSMGGMATRAVLDDGRMLKDHRTTVLLMAGKALVALAHKRGLVAAVRVMASGTAHCPF